MSRNNYIFVDFENLNESDLGRLRGRPAHVFLILGLRHKSLRFDLVELIHQHASQVTLVKTEVQGKNALDFVLACEVGRQTEKDPRGFFHILSGDKGYEATVCYLKGLKILAKRRESLAEIPALMTSVERVKCLTEQIRQKKSSLPTKRKTLESFVQTVFGRGLNPEELEETIVGLVGGKVVKIEGSGKVTYP